jgi:hypothetical protein
VKKLSFVIVALLTVGLGLEVYALADVGPLAGTHAPIVSTGSAAPAPIAQPPAPVVVTPPPADSHALPPPATAIPADPLAAPQATFDELVATKKLGWPILALVILIVACRVLAKLGGVFTPLGSGKVALGIAAVGAFALAAYNALALGGTWFAALLAAVVAGFAAWDSAAKPKAP